MLHYQAGSKEAHKERGTKSRSNKGTKERAEASPQANKERPPPIWQGAGIPSPHHKFAPKNQQKVAWVDMKKFSEKFFGGMFRGERKTPRVVSTEGG